MCATMGKPIEYYYIERDTLHQSWNDYSSIADDIEQRCEDAVFEVCDARERYPAMCANEKARSIRLENEICVEPVKSRIPTDLHTVLVTNEQKILFDSLGIGTKHNAIPVEDRSETLKNLLNKMEDLKIAADQMHREKNCEINRLLKK